MSNGVSFQWESLVWVDTSIVVHSIEGLFWSFQSKVMWFLVPVSQCLKIITKVAFNTASEAIYVYILSGQKFIKIAKKWSTWQLTSSWIAEARSQTVLPDRLILIGQKLVGNAKIEKCKWDICGDFQTTCSGVKKWSLFKVEERSHLVFCSLPHLTYKIHIQQSKARFT